MNLSQILTYIKCGYHVRRSGWNGKGMYIFIIKEWDFVIDNLVFHVDDNCETIPFLAMKTVDNKIVPWLCSQTDMLAEDWEIIEQGEESEEL